jgi:molybdenum cofactor cytidylyltransferase
MRLLASVMLAAGQSRRFGAAKLAHPWVAEPDEHSAAGLLQPCLLQHCLGELLVLTSSCGQFPALVLGGHRETLQPLVPPGVTVLHNVDWHSGMASSVAVAAAFARRQGAAALLIALADQPQVTSMHYLKLVNAWQESGMRVAAHYLDSPGVPAIFLAEDFNELITLTGDRGAKAMLMRFSREKQLMSIDMPEAAVDIDTQADLALWLANKE